MNKKRWQEQLNLAKEEINIANELKTGTKEDLKIAAQKVGYELEDSTEGFLVTSYNGEEVNRYIDENFLSQKIASNEYIDKQIYTVVDRIKDFFFR